MLRLFGNLTMVLLCMGITGTAAAAPIDCGPVPSAKCLAAAIFSLAKTLPANDGFRRHVGFAERELAPGDLKTALEYVVWDAPDSPSWDDIDWIARAGRFARAIERTRQEKSPVTRLGGMLAIGSRLLDKNNVARTIKIVDEVERELPSVPVADNDQEAGSLSRDAGELRARLGQLERAAQLIGGDREAVSTFLALANKYPVAASLREQAWQAADKAKEIRNWTQLVQDAIGRGDHAEISRVARRASTAISTVTNADDPMWVIPLAQVFATAGATEAAARVIGPWPQWVNEQNAISQYNNVNTLIPVLAGLGREDDVWKAANAVTDVYRRSQCLSTAAKAYFRLGRHDVGAKFDAEALNLADSPGWQGQRPDRDGALHNLALARAARGDIQGALVAVAKLSDAKKVRDVTSYVVRNAIDGGHGKVVAPAIESLQQLARDDRNVELLLRAGEGWQRIGNETRARQSLSQALATRDARQVALNWEQSTLAAELMWRLDGAGKPEAIIDIVDKLGINDAGHRLIEIARSLSPAVAVQLVERANNVQTRISSLAEIAIQIAGDDK